MDLNEIERHITEFHSTLTVLNEPSIVNQNVKGSTSLYSNDRNSPYGYVYCSSAILKFRLLFNANPIFEIHHLNEDIFHIWYDVDGELINHDLHITEPELFLKSTMQPVLDPDILVLVNTIFDHFENYMKKIETKSKNMV